MKYLVSLNGRTREVVVDGARVTVDGNTFEAELRTVPGTPIRILLLDGVSWPLTFESPARGSWIVQAHGDRHEAGVLDERTVRLRSLGTAARPAGHGELKAPMPGLVVRVLVEPGQKVVEGASLIVLEAMKMENELKAASNGVVEAIAVSRGQTVEKGQVLLTYAAPER